MTGNAQPPHSDPDENNRHIVDLEERFTFQQLTLDQLNEVVRKQQLEINRMRSELDRYRTELEQLSKRDTDDGLPLEKPPHY